VLLNSFINDIEPKKLITYDRIIEDSYILIMASKFSFWHNLTSLFDAIEGSELKLVVLGNTSSKINYKNVIFYGYTSDDDELLNLISNSLNCIDSLGFDKLNLNETSSLKLFKYLENGGRVAVSKELPFKDEFLSENFIFKFNNTTEILNYVNKLEPLSRVEKKSLINYMYNNYSLKDIITKETNFIAHENNR
jgi:hypothetical protein